MRHYYQSIDYSILCQNQIKEIENQIEICFGNLTNIENQKFAKNYTRIIFSLIDSFNPSYKKIHKYRKGSNLKDSRADILRKINIKSPYLVWDIYRNKSIHNNKFGILIYKKTIIFPNWTINNIESVSYDKYEVKSFSLGYNIGSNSLLINTKVNIYLNVKALILEYKKFLNSEMKKYGNNKVRIYQASKIMRCNKNDPYLKEVENILND